MDFNDFKSLVVERVREHPVWFGLPSDKFANTDAVNAAEKELCVKFPVEYVEFLKNYGGGYFALGIVFSLDCESEFYILNKNACESVLRSGYLIFSENGVGDYYGFPVVSGECRSEVFFYDHEDASWGTAGSGNLFDFLARFALSN